jgi:hypothetical protein
LGVWEVVGYEVCNFEVRLWGFEVWGVGCGVTTGSTGDGIRAYVHACIRAYVHTRIRAYVHACIRACGIDIRANVRTCRWRSVFVRLVEAEALNPKP